MEHSDTHHEESDVNVRGIFMFGMWLAAVAAVIHLAIWGVFVLLERRETTQSVQEFPLAAGQELRLPPEPRLQTVPRLDLQALRAREDEQLQSYGWIDRDAGIVRIPIDEAMKLTLQRGLPTRPPQEPPR
jgi:hypothetical protein